MIIHNAYEELFSEKDKAAAFDLIAEKYYYSNFGSTSKADFETLLFSIFIERILDSDQDNIDAYSDYTLSKQLGITQSKVSSLKVRKELQYPYEKFNWIDALKRISNRAVFENGKIRLFIPDKNVYLEVKNVIEKNGGYVEVQRTGNLLQVRLPYYLDLLVAISTAEENEAEKDPELIRKEIKEQLRELSIKNDIDLDLEKGMSFGEALAGVAPEVLFGLIGECIPVFGKTVKLIGEGIFKAINGSKKSAGLKK